MGEKQTTQEQAARRIAGLLALAEDAAKKGDETLRDNYLAKTTALQHQYAVDQVMMEKNSGAKADKIVFDDFCAERNTPLIKAKRELIQALCNVYRGKALLMGRYKTDANGNPAFKNGQPVYEKRAFVRVYAHQSDLDFIRQMYVSLLLQMQSMMAQDERHQELFTGVGKVANAWRVSYAHAWVNRVYFRMMELKRSQERDASQASPGAALMLRDKGQLVERHVEEAHGKLRTSRYKTETGNTAGRAAGDAAGRRADLGQKRAGSTTRAAVE